jgi:phosphatidate cytidylyltransferase
MIISTIAIILGFYALILLVMTLIFKLQRKDVKSMWTRYVTWFLIIPPLLIPLLYSKTIFQVVVFVLSLFCLHEYSRVVGLWKDRYYMALCYVSIALCYVPVFLGRFGFFEVIPVYLLILVLLVPVVRGEYEHMIQKSCLAMLGVSYFGWLFAHIGFLRNTENGIAYVFLLLILVETNDASAYIVGRLFGKNKLAPKISPNKTNEGFLGGLLMTIILSFLLRPLAPDFSIIHRVLFAAVISVGGTCGDLVMSFIKRDLGLKDFSQVLPGHGGLLDRFDSLIFVAPLFFHLVNLFYELV